TLGDALSRFDDLEHWGAFRSTGRLKMSQPDADKLLYLPHRELDSLVVVDAEADRVRRELDWLLAAFIAIFDETLEQVLVVQLGDYARPRYDGNPWTLPGGSVEANEFPT